MPKRKRKTQKTNSGPSRKKRRTSKTTTEQKKSRQEFRLISDITSFDDNFDIKAVVGEIRVSKVNKNSQKYTPIILYQQPPNAKHSSILVHAYDEGQDCITNKTIKENDSVAASINYFIRQKHSSSQTSPFLGIIGHKGNGSIKKIKRNPLNILIKNPSLKQIEELINGSSVSVAGSIMTDGVQKEVTIKKNNKKAIVTNTSINIDNNFKLYTNIWHALPNKIKKDSIIQVIEGKVQIYNGLPTITALEYIVNNPNTQTKSLKKKLNNSLNLSFPQRNYNDKYEDAELISIKKLNKIQKKINSDQNINFREGAYKIQPKSIVHLPESQIYAASPHNNKKLKSVNNKYVDSNGKEVENHRSVYLQVYYVKNKQNDGGIKLYCFNEAVEKLYGMPASEYKQFNSIQKAEHWSNITNKKYELWVHIKKSTYNNKTTLKIHVDDFIELENAFIVEDDEDEETNGDIDEDYKDDDEDDDDEESEDDIDLDDYSDDDF